MLYKFTTDKRNYIPILILFQNSLFLYLAIFLHSIGPLSWLRYSLFPTLVSLSIMMNIKRKMIYRIGDILLFYVLILVLIINEICFPDNNSFFHEGLGELIWSCFGGYFLGLNVYGFLQREEENEWNNLYILAVISTVVMVIYAFRTMTTGSVLRYLQDRSDMATAYNALPCLMILCWKGINKPQAGTLLLFMLSIIYLFSLGTRGAMVWLLVFVVVCVILRLIEHGSISKWVIVLGLVLILLSFGTELLTLLQNVFSKLGFSVRILDRINAGDFFVSNSRNQNWERIVPYLKENWVLGNGLFADRRIIGTYAHNIALEVLLDFGYIGGGIVLLCIIYCIIKALIIEQSSDIRCIIILLTFTTIGKLLISSSYLKEPLFFMLIAVCVSAIRNVKDRQLGER